MANLKIWMGHSGAEKGAVGLVVEDDITRQARIWSVEYARSCGHSVGTDNDDMSLSQRIAASQNGDGLIEWHVNSGGGTGIEVWYSTGSAKGKQLAQAVVNAGATASGMQNRGVKASNTNRFGSLGILDRTKPAAVLVELFFLDSASDVAVWNAHGKEMVVAMTKAFLESLGVQSTPTGQAPTPSKPSPSSPAPSQPAKSEYEVKAWNKRQVVDIDVLNVRTTATSQSKLVRKLVKGQTFNATRIITNGELVGKYRSWFEADGWGWVSGAYVTEIKASTPKLKGSDLPNSGRYTFTANTNIRSNASTGSSVVGLYSKGQSVIYDSKIIAGGYVWLSYIGASGNRRYVAVV